jgi:signal transduction histidine kinase
LTPLYESKSADIAKGNSNTAACLRQFSGLAVVCTDISAMVHAELALVQSQKEREALAASEEAAREASRLKTVFVTSLSHEIRTPISGMLGISELLLRDDSLSDKHRSLVQKQLHAGELLLQLVSMVLDIGKMEANKLELEHEPFFISELMSDLDIFASLADAKGIYFERIVDVMQDCAFEGDRLRLAQVLSNFISK